MSQFDAVYADRTVISGSTAAEFAALPDTGLLFVVVLHDDGSVENYSGLESYEYLGQVKPGSLTSDDNYRSIREDLPYLSFLLDPSKHRAPRRVSIDVSDISPAVLLSELFNNASQDSIGELPYDHGETMSAATAQAMLDKTNFRDQGAYFRTVRGRYLRVNITGYFIDPTKYNQRHAAGTLQRIVDAIRGGQ